MLESDRRLARVEQAAGLSRAGGRVQLGRRHLALDTLGRPHLSYIANGYSSGMVRYATLSGTAWVTETVGSAGWYPQGTSLALDAAGRPRIAWYDADCADLRYAERISEGLTRFYIPLIVKRLGAFPR